MSTVMVDRASDNDRLFLAHISNSECIQPYDVGEGQLVRCGSRDASACQCVPVLCAAIHARRRGHISEWGVRCSARHLSQLHDVLDAHRPEFWCCSSCAGPD